MSVQKDQPSPRARWRDPVTGKHRSKSFRTATAAKRYERKIRNQIDDGNYVDPNLGNILFGEWAWYWYADRRPLLRPLTRQSYDSIMRSRIVPHFGRRRMAQIDNGAVQNWVSSLDLKPRTVRKYLAVLHAMFDTAVERDVVRRNPCDRVRLPPLSSLPVDVWTPDEVEHFAEVIEEPYGALALVQGVMGLRFGEVAHLRVKDIDLDALTLHVRGSTGEAGGVLVDGDTKSGKPRKLPLPDRVAASLRPLVDGRGADAPLYEGERGGRLRYQNFRRRTWLPALAEAGLSAPDGMATHILRHSAASAMIDKGASIVQVQRMLGHADPSTTLNIYTHLFADSMDSLRDVL